jgi:hypothetical protein
MLFLLLRDCLMAVIRTIQGTSTAIHEGANKDGFTNTWLLVNAVVSCRDKSVMAYRNKKHIRGDIRGGTTWFSYHGTSIR